MNFYNLDINGDRRWVSFTADSPENLADIAADPYVEAIIDSEVGIIAYTDTADTADALRDVLYWAVEVVLAKSQGGDLLGTIDALAAALNPLAERPE